MSFTSTPNQTTSAVAGENPPPSSSSPPTRQPGMAVERTGIIDENGAMTNDFMVGEFDEELIDSVVNGKNGSDEGLQGENFERHCPPKGKGLDSLVPRPKDYKLRIPWPKSRDEIWLSNVHTPFAKDKAGNTWVKGRGDKYIFQETGHNFPRVPINIWTRFLRWFQKLLLANEQELPWILFWNSEFRCISDGHWRQLCPLQLKMCITIRSNLHWALECLLC
ncbi:hypothetical protein HAX54_048043 [Datura stramonium]|uniref:Methyltransferase n=1 Tax=Datura stramonium TaxID=4076 RepID=A0ABS8WMM3_DATST|nr:hypothetical protein [Datura stramonium]